MVDIYIHPPSMDVTETEGFERDRLGRKDFGETLAQILENQPGGNVFALDAGWGQGKTTFIKMWRGHVGHIRENKLQTIYFDAFASDYQQDPFLALATEIYGKIRKKSLIKNILSVGKLKAAGSIIGGALLESTVGETGSEVAKKFFEAYDIILTEKLEEAKKAKSAIQIFRESLEQHVKKISPDKPLIFIVDELDRCRPDFALDLLETIKHFFEVRGIIFLLVMNHESLNDMIRTRYGTKEDKEGEEGKKGARYMQKFVQCWINLPEPDIEKYAKAIGLGREGTETCPQSMLLAMAGKASLREIERIRTYESLLVSLMGIKHIPYYDYPRLSQEGQEIAGQQRWTIALLSYLRVMNPNSIQEILDLSERSINAP